MKFNGKQTRKIAMLAKGTAVAVGLISALAGCSNSSNDNAANDKKLINLAKIKTSNATPSEKAEQIALAAEQLVGPSTFMFANAVADQALTIDPTNTRARFWKSATAPLMEFAGIVARIEPMAKQSPHLYADYKRFVRQIKATPVTSIREFLLKGPKDIASERDAQDVLARFTARLDDLRNVVKDLKGRGDFVVHLNADVMKNSASDSNSPSVNPTCVVQNPSTDLYTMDGCDVSSAYEITLNQADFELLQHAIAGYQVYFTLLNSYSATGAVQIGLSGHGQSSQQTVSALMANSDFGKLIDGKSLGIVPQIAQDLVLGARYAEKMQGDLCPNTQPDEIKRPGHLFASGLCIGDANALEQQLKIAESILSGQSQAIIIHAGNTDVSAVVQPMRLFTSPTADLHALMPVQFDNCGTIDGIADGTLSGVFPSGNINTILQLSSAANCNLNSYPNPYPMSVRD